MLENAIPVETILDQVPAIALSIVVIAQFCNKTDLPTQTFCCDRLIGPFTPKDSHQIFSYDGLSGIVEAGNFKDEINIGTAKNENFAFHEALR